MTGVCPQVHKMGCREGRTSGEKRAVGDGQGILEEAVGLLHRIFARGCLEEMVLGPIHS